MYGFTYKITNLLNGKIYIGQTTQIKKKRKRWNDHCRAARTGHRDSGSRLYNAMRKYGQGNFNYEIISVAYSKEELDRQEIEYISKHNSTCASIGYNIASGGNGAGQMPKETRIKMSLSKKGIAKTHIARQRMSASAKTRFADKRNHPMFGKKQSPEHYKKTLDYIKTTRKPVAQIDANGAIIARHESLMAAAKALDLFPEQIKRCCCGKQKLAGGFKWKFVDSQSTIDNSDQIAIYSV